MADPPPKARHHLHGQLQHPDVDVAEGGLRGAAGSQPRLRRLDDSRGDRLPRSHHRAAQPRLVVSTAEATTSTPDAAPRGDARLRALVASCATSLPTTRLLYISVAPNPARWSQVETVKAVNRAVQWRAESDPRITYIDVFSRMLGPDGHPLPDIFVEDGLHMNAKGYAIWTAVVRPFLRF